MVKTVYALALLAAVSIAAPVPRPHSRSGDLSDVNLRRDGFSNLIGVGADSGVGQLLQGLTGRDVHEHEERQLTGILGNLPLIGSLTGGDNKDHKQGQDQKGQDKQGENDEKPRQLGHSGILNGALGNVLPPLDRRNVNEHEARQLEQLTGKQGLGALFGNSHHGIGLLPQRRNENEHDTRAAPIQSSTLTGFLLNGGALGKLAGIIPGSKK